MTRRCACSALRSRASWAAADCSSTRTLSSRFSRNRRSWLAKYSAMRARASLGTVATCWIGCARTERDNRTASSAWKRWSAIIRATAASVKKVRRARGLGPLWKKAGESREIKVWPEGPGLKSAYASVIREDTTQFVHLFQGSARTSHHTSKRVISHDDGQSGLFHQEPVELAQQRAAPGEHHALLGDVGAELRGRLLQRALDRGDDGVQRIGERLEDLVG